MKVLNLMFFICIFSCSPNKSDCDYYSGELLRNYLEKVEIKRIDSTSGAILEIIDKVNDKSHFGNYAFYNDGMLESYKFFGNAFGYSYNEEYDEHGKLIKIEGSPLVLRNIKDVSKDSLFIQFYFSSINKTYDSLNIQLNRRRYIGLKIKPDSTYSNMMKASSGFNVANMDTIKFYLMANVRSKCKTDFNKIKDTFFLITNNHIHEMISNKHRRLLEKF